MTDPHKAARLRLVEEDVAEALSSLEVWFIPGTTLTLVARHPTCPDAHLVVTKEESLGVVIIALEETIRSRDEAGLI